MEISSKNAVEGVAHQMEVAPKIDTLRAYTRTKQAIAQEVRSLRRLLTDRGNEKADAECRELMVKLAEDRFTLAVLGLFKRGKSSLMNAIIGRDLLPTGVLPLTSAITVLRFGPKEQLVVDREGVFFTEETSVSRLAEYVTEEGNPGNRKKVKTAKVEVPLPFLRQGLEFVDTPGIGSAIAANTATTYEFLPQSDAVIFVTSVDAPLSQAEIDFLDRVRAHVRKIFVVVNKTDLLADSERDQMLAFIAATLEQRTGGEKFPTYPVSSRLGLEAKKAGDPDGYARSGLKDLEEALAVYLSSEKSSTFLVAILDRALRLIADGTGGDAAKEGPGGALSARLDGLRQRLLAGEVFDPRRDAPPAPVEIPKTVSQPSPEEKAGAVQGKGGALNLRTRGCPVCNYLRKAVFDFFTQWQYALAEERDVQEVFAAELGFCPLHTWQLVAIASPQGLSQGYPRLLDRLSGDLSRLAGSQTDAKEGLQSLVLGLKDCRACRFLHEKEEAVLRRLASFVAGEAGRQTYAQFQGVCLRHLALLLDFTSPEAAQFLLSGAARRFEECAEDMRSFATKRDAIRRALIHSDEEDAYVRGIIHIVGDQGLSAPPSGDPQI
ncbi:MAG: hypothetical protein A3F84_06055 [Candidatus Handelsmanbacteria bacterium RIFCSPLOWO2_12_FULL_64_10]|uniref:Dynamin N-terminal domain-containing protein n=1 Tax=Handelsmanbacteria sp. (strain RIFCSPLOWO2_12_FULL_64_10) TaxID=1817868 RepID=A0A1F6D1Y1_HANXR|nr:MAG: hypothetical protein A3F84_06055 [Candidatus Handelsmanbacteria bacterium RIFCSPLOWO2_12_FULL_64_10]